MEVWSCSLLMWMETREMIRLFFSTGDVGGKTLNWHYTRFRHKNPHLNSIGMIAKSGLHAQHQFSDHSLPLRFYHLKTEQKMKTENWFSLLCHNPTDNRWQNLTNLYKILHTGVINYIYLIFYPPFCFFVSFIKTPIFSAKVSICRSFQTINLMHANRCVF